MKQKIKITEKVNKIMKILLTVIFLVSSQIAFAQNQIFLANKTHDLPNTNISAGNINNQSVVPSISFDKRLMAVNVTRFNFEQQKDYSHKANMKLNSLLFDLETGNVVKEFRNASLHFMKDGLLKTDYGDIWDKKVDHVSELNTNMQYQIIDSFTGQNKQSLKLPGGHIFSGTSGEYVTSQEEYITTTYLWEKTPAGLQQVGSFPFNAARISADEKLVSGAITDDQNPENNRVVIYDIESGNEVKNIYVEGNPIVAKIINSRMLVYSYVSIDKKTYNVISGIKVVDLNTEKELANFTDSAAFITDDAGETMLIHSKEKGEIKLIDLGNFSTLNTERFAYVDEGNPYAEGISTAVKVGDGDFFLIANSSGIINVVSNKEKKIIADIYVDQEDWAVVARDGRVDGTPGALDKLELREYNRNGKVVNRTSLDAAFNNFFTPRLLPSLLRDEMGDITELREQMAKAPSVEIVRPSDGIKASEQQVSVIVKATANGDPVKEIQLFVNGKLFGEGERGLKVVKEGDERTFNVSLVPGKNVISVRAVSQKNYESGPAYLEIAYEGRQLTSNLHILAVGIDEYVNSSYNLNYAVADAGAIVENIQSRSAGIFGQTLVHTVYNQEASKEQILQKFQQIAENSKPEDVFVFFYAGHGVMSEGSEKDFYLALHEVTQLYGKENLLRSSGISALELRELTSAIKAQKQMIILDACQSGGAVETFALRGAAQEKAMIQLARSTGVTLLASTGSEQFATEFEQLGHGVFTYALLDGLSGKADGGSRDGKITVKELEAYLNDTIPELTQRYKGAVQFPRSWSQGMDFPLTVINN